MLEKNKQICNILQDTTKAKGKLYPYLKETNNRGQYKQTPLLVNKAKTTPNPYQQMIYTITSAKK